MFLSENVNEMWLNDLKGIRAHFWGEIITFLVMNDHFGGPSVHCRQILQKNPGKGAEPPLSGNARILGAYRVYIIDPQPIN